MLNDRLTNSILEGFATSDRCKKPNRDVLLDAACAQSYVEQTSQEVLRTLSYADRYDLIHEIQSGIEERYPAPKRDPYEPITQHRVLRELRALSRISNTLSLSDQYKDFILHVSKEAARKLMQDTGIVSKLLDWNTLHTKEKLKLGNAFQQAMIESFKSGLKEYECARPFGEVVRPVPVEGRYRRPTIKKGYIASMPMGRAEFDQENPFPKNKSHITANTHKYSMLASSPESAIGLFAHETAHIIEYMFASQLNFNPDSIPQDFKNDAKLLSTLHRQQGCITSRLGKLYELQANENVAFAAEEVATGIVVDCLSSERAKIQSRDNGAARSYKKPNVVATPA